MPMQDPQETCVQPLGQRSPGGGNGNPFQYSLLENPMDLEACWASVPGVTENQTQLSPHTHTHPLRNQSFTPRLHCRFLTAPPLYHPPFPNWRLFEPVLLGLREGHGGSMKEGYYPYSRNGQGGRHRKAFVPWSPAGFCSISLATASFWKHL